MKRGLWPEHLLHPVLTPNSFQQSHCTTNVLSQRQESRCCAATKFLYDQGSNLLWGQSTSSLRSRTNRTMHGCLRLMLGQRYRGKSTGCQGGMSKPQGCEWIYSPAGILFGWNGPVVLSQCVINNTERWTGSKEKLAGRKREESFPPLPPWSNVSYLGISRTHYWRTLSQGWSFMPNIEWSTSWCQTWTET